MEKTVKTYKSTIDKISLVKEKTEFKKVKVTDSFIASDFIRSFYSDDIEIFESFFLLLLNNSNNTIGYAKISQGGITGTLIDTRIVAKYALDGLATGVILAHNHPSGTLKPSNADKELTQKIKKGLALLDIKVLDHIILTADSYYSFGDDNLI